MKILKVILCCVWEKPAEIILFQKSFVLGVVQNLITINLFVLMFNTFMYLCHLLSLLFYCFSLFMFNPFPFLTCNFWRWCSISIDLVFQNFLPKFVPKNDQFILSARYGYFSNGYDREYYHWIFRPKSMVVTYIYFNDKSGNFVLACHYHLKVNKN